MKIYLSGRYSDRSFLRGIAVLLEHAGHVVTSRWIYTVQVGSASVEEMSDAAEGDLTDIDRSDCFVLYSHSSEPLPTRQAHSVELGYALGRAASGAGIVICLIGEKTDNVFHHMKRVQHFSDWPDLFSFIGPVGMHVHVATI